LSFILAPLANLIERLRIGKVPSVFIAVALALGVILGIGGLIGTQLADLAQNAPRYQAEIQRKFGAVGGFLTHSISGLTGSIKPENSASDQAAPKDKADEGPPKIMPVEVHQPELTPFETAQKILSPAVSPLEILGVVFIVAIFALLQREDLRNRLIRLFGSRDLHRTTVGMDDAASRLSRYFLTQLTINACFGTMIAIGLFFIGVPSPILWGVLGTLLRFVPYFGSILSAAGPLALAAGVEPGWMLLFWTLGLYLVVDLAISQGIEPLVYGRNTGLSSISVVISAMFWTWLWDRLDWCFRHRSRCACSCWAGMSSVWNSWTLC
jgi:predicted PurR-regulated permease PerM